MDTTIIGIKGIKADVTGQNELLVKVGDSGNIASETTTQSILDEVTIIANNSDSLRVPNMIRVSTSGTIPGNPHSVSFANVGNLNVTVLGATLKPAETVSFDAGGMNNRFSTSTLTYDSTGSELLIIYIS